MLLHWLRRNLVCKDNSQFAELEQSEFERGYAMIEVKFYDHADDKLLKFAVIISKTNGKWVFCKHRE